MQIQIHASRINSSPLQIPSDPDVAQFNKLLETLKKKAPEITCFNSAHSSSGLISPLDESDIFEDQITKLSTQSAIAILTELETNSKVLKSILDNPKSNVFESSIELIHLAQHIVSFSALKNYNIHKLDLLVILSCKDLTPDLIKGLFSFVDFDLLIPSFHFHKLVEKLNSQKLKTILDQQNQCSNHKYTLYYPYDYLDGNPSDSNHYTMLCGLPFYTHEPRLPTFVQKPYNRTDIQRPVPTSPLHSPDRKSGSDSDSEDSDVSDTEFFGEMSPDRPEKTTSQKAEESRKTTSPNTVATDEFTDKCMPPTLKREKPPYNFQF